MKPRFSIIMPLYNKEAYVKKALDSICAQTFKDFECIVVDDGSTDGSLDLVRDFVRNDGMTSVTDKSLNEPLSLNDGRLKILTQSNSGVSAARNNGVTASKGEYICFLDADDWWEPTFLEHMAQLIADYPDAGIYAMNYIYYKPGKTHVALTLKTGYINYPQSYYQSGAMPIWTGAACMPRKVFDEMGGFPLGVKLGEDFLLWAKTALHYPVAFCEKPLAYYNNDVPVALRATRNLHAPEHHMLFLLEPIEQVIMQLQDEEVKHDWKLLLDKLRVNGLLEYWMDDRYHDMAAQELKKVDWSQQPSSALRTYKMPIWFLRVKRRFLQIGSHCKQKLIRMRK